MVLELNAEDDVGTDWLANEEYVVVIRVRVVDVGFRGEE